MTNGAICYSDYYKFLNNYKKDKIFFYPIRAKQLTDKMKHSMSYLLTLIVCYTLLIFCPILIIIVQFTPILFKKHSEKIIQHLPYIDNFNILLVIKDIFALYYYTLKFYRPVCWITRKQLDDLIDDFDEQIDSLEYAISNHESLEAIVDEIKAQYK